jgi:hypothetical protein
MLCTHPGRGWPQGEWRVQFSRRSNGVDPFVSIRWCRPKGVDPFLLDRGAEESEAFPALEGGETWAPVVAHDRECRFGLRLPVDCGWLHELSFHSILSLAHDDAIAILVSAVLAC